MFERIYLHIGATKTGTSAIQTSLARSRAILLENGILYPNTENDDKAIEGKVTGGNARTLCELHLNFKNNIGNVSQMTNDYFNDLDKNKSASTLLFSGEAMGRFSVDYLKILRSILDKFTKEVSIIYYVRHISGHAASQYSEYVKRRSMTAPFEEYLTRYTAPYLRTLKAYEEAFSPEAIQVRLYDDVKEDLLADFASALGLSGVELVETGEINRSLSHKELRIMRRLNETGANGNVIAKLSQHIISLPQKETTKHNMPIEQFDLIERRNRRVLNHINTHYTTDWTLKVVDANEETTPTENTTVPEFDETDEYYLQMLESVLSSYQNVEKKLSQQDVRNPIHRMLSWLKTFVGSSSSEGH